MEHVTAKQAADMTGQSERTIRRWIQSGRLRARKIAPNRYEIAVSDLPPRKRSPMADLRAEVEALRVRVDALEAAQRTPMPSVRLYRESDGLPAHSASVYSSGAYDLPAPQPGRTGTFSDELPTLAHYARWLVEHGVNAEGTPKSWYDRATGQRWNQLPLDKRAVLLFAMRQRDGDHRRTWRLHRCGDPLCVCAELLPDG